jgi:hypothetical protein
MRELIDLAARLVRTDRRLKRVFGAQCPAVTIDRALYMQLVVT